MPWSYAGKRNAMPLFRKLVYGSLIKVHIWLSDAHPPGSLNETADSLSLYFEKNMWDFQH